MRWPSVRKNSATTCPRWIGAPSQMCCAPLRDHQQLPRDVAQQVAQKPHHSRCVERARLHLLQQPAVVRQAPDDRQMVARERDAQDRRLAPWRVGAHRGGQQVEGRLVYPDDGSAFCDGFFLSAGRRCAAQSVMAASSRWAARVIGFCTDQPIRRSRRLTWAG
jgi:hypothetical protein